MLSLLNRPKQDAAAGETPAAAAPNGSQPAASNGFHAAAATQAAPSARTCAKCGAPLLDLQDWCLQCGAGQPGSLRDGSGWRTAAGVLAATLLLVAGASVAAYAALKKHSRKALPTVALHSPAVGTVPGTTTVPGTSTVPGTTVPVTPGTSTVPGGGTTAPGLPTTIKATPPKIPLQTPTPKPSEGGGAELTAGGLVLPKPKAAAKKAKPAAKTAPAPAAGTSEEAGAGESQPSGEGQSGGSEEPSPILLDTNAASTYNPSNYPATYFGDPSLAIDGEASTAWTAQVDPTTAPRMAEGLLLDLKSRQHLASATVKTSTKGMTVEIFAANAATAPATITDPAWKRLTGAKTLKKKNVSLKLKTAGQSYRFVLLWIVKGPATSTAATPGHVAVNELELFP